MKELKEIKKVYLKEYDLYVNPYLTYEQIQQIANAIRGKDAWAEMQRDVDILVMHYCTDISDEILDKTEHALMLQSGVLDAVKSNIKNYNKIFEAVNYVGALQKAVRELIAKAPVNALVAKDGAGKK